MRGRFWSWVITIAAIGLFSQAANAGTLFPRVVVVTAPLKPYVDEILKGVGESQSLLRPGQDPHSFGFSGSQAEMLEQADVLIVPSLAINPYLVKLAAKCTQTKHCQVIELTKLAGAEPLTYPVQNPLLAPLKKADVKEEGHDHDNDAVAPEKEVKKDSKPAKPLEDPHLWLDPERMAAIATPLAQAMGNSAPEHRPTLLSNAQKLAFHLRQEVMPELRGMLSKPPTEENGMGQKEIPFITYHAAYYYFLARFGLQSYGELTMRPEELLGAKTVAGVMTKLEQSRVRCMIGEQPTTMMTRAAKSANAKLVILSPEQLPERGQMDAVDWIRNDYDRFLYVTAKAFAGCL